MTTRYSRGSTLQADLVREGASEPQGWAINDIVVRSGMRMVDIEIYIDGHYVNTYPGDGMIVATPHGSTAYCMAAGGPILTAGVKGFAIVPISCHSPIRTPFVVSEEAIIEMVVANAHESALILDGREQAHLERWDIVRISRGEHAFKLVTLKSTNFYEAFRTKFNFGFGPMPFLAGTTVIRVIGSRRARRVSRSTTQSGPQAAGQVRHGRE